MVLGVGQLWIFGPVIVEKGVVALGSELFLLGKVCELAAEAAALHVSVRKNYYNATKLVCVILVV